MKLIKKSAMTVVRDNKLLVVRKLRAAFPGIIADYTALLFTGTLKVRYLPF